VFSGGRNETDIDLLKCKTQITNFKSQTNNKSQKNQKPNTKHKRATGKPANGPTGQSFFALRASQDRRANRSSLLRSYDPAGGPTGPRANGPTGPRAHPSTRFARSGQTG